MTSASYTRWSLRQRLCLAVVLAPLSICAQQAPPAANSNNIHQLSVLVDGSKTPELIPDELAYNHYILTITEHANPTPEEVRRRDSRIHPIHLPYRTHRLS